MSWPAVPVTEVARVVGGATPKSAIEEFWDGDVNWVTPKDLSNLDGKYIAETPRKITAQGLRSCAAELLPANSVLFSSRAPIGHVAINAEPMATNQGFKSFVPGAELDASFLYWWLDANRRYLQSLGTGATFKEVSKAVVQRIKIPLPPLEEQRRIAGILDQADALRRLRTRALDKLNTLGQAIFHEMFGDPVSNEFNLPVSNIESLCQVISDCLHKTPVHTDDLQGYPSVRSPDLQAGFLTLEKVKRVTVDTYRDRIQRHKPVAGDVIYCREGARYGNCGMVPEGVDLCLGQRTMLFQAKSGVVTPEFLWATICSPWLRKQADLVVGGAASPHVNIKDIRKFTCLLPPHELQELFSRRSTVAMRGRDEALRAVASIEALFASLQHRAFRGEL